MLYVAHDKHFGKVSTSLFCLAQNISEDFLRFLHDYFLPRAESTLMSLTHVGGVQCPVAMPCTGTPLPQVPMPSKTALFASAGVTHFLKNCFRLSPRYTG